MGNYRSYEDKLGSFLRLVKPLAGRVSILPPVLLDGLKDFRVGGDPLLGKNDGKMRADHIDRPLYQSAESFQGLVLTGNGPFRVGQQGKGKSFFVAIIVMRFDRGRVDGQNFGAYGGKFILIRLKGGQLTVSPRGVVFGVENQDGIVGFAFRQGHFAPAGTFERKTGSLLASLKHFNSYNLQKNPVFIFSDYT